MIRTKNSIAVSIIIFTIFCMSTTAFAEGAKELKARMKARLPEINQLKSSGVVGERSDGLLAFVTGVSKKAALVNGENSDRKKVYAAIAKQQGTTVEVVGKRRALQIFQKAKPGTWLYNAQRSWFKK